MRCVQADAGFLVLLGLLLFLLDPAVSAGVLLSAALHECGHLLALRLFGGRQLRLRLGLPGAEIRYDGKRLSYGKEALCALAGPCASLLCGALLSLLGHRLGQTALYIPAGAAVLQGFFNLLPLRCLDGGRALYMCLCARRGIAQAEKALCLLSCGGALALLLLGLWLALRTRRNFSLLFLGAWLLLGECRRLTKAHG